MNSELYCAQLEMVNEKLLKIRLCWLIEEVLYFYMIIQNLILLRWSRKKSKNYSGSITTSTIFTGLSFKWFSFISDNGAFPSQPKIQKFRWWRFSLCHNISNWKIRNSFPIDSINYLHVGKKSLTAMEIISLNNYCCLCVI